MVLINDIKKEYVGWNKKTDMELNSLSATYYLCDFMSDR